MTHKNTGTQELARFFAPAEMRLRTFPNTQEFDFDGLRGRLLSSSYSPLPGHPNYELMLAALEGIFQTHQVHDRVTYIYTTQVFYGQLK